MTGEEFTRFLTALSQDENEAGTLYNRLSAKLEGFFAFKGVSDPVGAAAETIRRAAAKIVAGAEVPDVTRYCLGIARNIVKEQIRKDFRRSKAHQGFVDEMMNQTGEQLERIYQLLLPCFAQLPMEDQELLTDYCKVMQGRGRAEHRRQLAESRKTTLLGLRMRVTRLRATLAECVKQRRDSV